MAIRTRRPIPRVRSGRFGGGAGGSQFAGTTTINLSGLDKVEQLLAGPRLAEIVERRLNPVKDLAQEKAPVRTGELRDSAYVSVEVSGATASGEVGFTANHAPPVEFGSQGREARPFLRPAWDEAVTFGNAKQAMADDVRDLLSELGGD
jgi:HK97 gp10 family phage protein